MMTETEFSERLTALIRKAANGREAIFCCTRGGNQSCSSKLFIVDRSTVDYTGALACDSEYDALGFEMFRFFTHGIHLMRFANGKCVDKRHIRYYNPERMFNGIEYLTIWQEYGLEPLKEQDKEALADSIKAEKIKETLVWACYIGDKGQIRKHLSDPKLKPAQLNKKLDPYGNPLILCAINGDLESFAALLEKGADISKKPSCNFSPLITAFRNNRYDIVRFIFDNCRGQFDKEIKSFGDALLQDFSDERFYELLVEGGVDFGCQEGARYPTLHIYAENNNANGVKFLLSHGVNPNLLNKDRKTALQLAEAKNCEQTAEVLRSFGAK